jgi:acyl-CoA thioester hydrolase
VAREGRSHDARIGFCRPQYYPIANVMPGSRLLVHTCTVPIRWGDMDALGHVNNVVYFQYMQQTRSDWLYRGIEGGGYDPGQSSVIINASCEFLAPLEFPGEVVVRMFLGDVGRTSVWSYYEIVADERVHATGAAKMVWVELASGRASPLPERIAAPLRALAAGPAPTVARPQTHG